MEVLCTNLIFKNHKTNKVKPRSSLGIKSTTGILNSTRLRQSKTKVIGNSPIVKRMYAMWEGK